MSNLMDHVKYSFQQQGVYIHIEKLLGRLKHIVYFYLSVDY